MTFAEMMYSEKATSDRLEKLATQTRLSKEEIIAAALIFYEDMLKAFDESTKHLSNWYIVHDPYEEVLEVR